MDVSFVDEEPKIIKVGIQLMEDELLMYKSLMIKYQDIFTWSYKDLKDIPLEVA